MDRGRAPPVGRMGFLCGSTSDLDPGSSTAVTAKPEIDGRTPQDRVGRCGTPDVGVVARRYLEGDQQLTADDRQDARARGGVRGLRVLTHLVGLEPSGGIELTVLQDSLALADRGHTFDIVYGNVGTEEALRSTYEERRFGLEGPREFDLDLRHPLRMAQRYLPAARWARWRNVDVVWLNRFEHIVWGQAVARWSGVPLVCHLHEVPMFNRLRILGSGVAEFVAVSEYVRQAWIERGLASERVSLVHNAVPAKAYPEGGRLEREQARLRLGLPVEVPIVLCYGRMLPEKGIGELLSAWAEVIARHPGALLVLVGSPGLDEHPGLAAAAAALPPGSYRWFAETVEVLDHLHACDVVAFPSLLEEAFGRVVIEGMSTGRPVVANRVGGVSEILTGAMAEFLVTPGSPAELAEKLLRVLLWRHERPTLGAECARWIEVNFPFRAHIDALEEVLIRNQRRPTALGRGRPSRNTDRS